MVDAYREGIERLEGSYARSFGTCLGVLYENTA